MFCRATANPQLGAHYSIIYGEKWYKVPEGRLEGIMASINPPQIGLESDNFGKAPKMLIFRYVSSRQSNGSSSPSATSVNFPALIAGLEDGAFKDYEV